MAVQFHLRWLHRVAPPTAPTKRQGRFGVLSGTFNPPTTAHLALARAASTALQLDEVVFILPETPPHKPSLEASLEDRAEMLRLAVAAEPAFSAAVVSHGLFLDIHAALRPSLPTNTRFFFLTGRDAAHRILVDWPYPDTQEALAEMFARFEFVVAARSGPFVVPNDSPAAQYAGKIHSVQLPEGYDEVSATVVRERIARGEPFDRLVPAPVAAYIRDKRLYSV